MNQLAIPTEVQVNMLNENLPQLPRQSLATTSIEQARAIQEIQAMCVIAQNAPRDVTRCYIAVMKELERYSLARSALYAFPRGNATVTGPSIRMIEMIARNFKNLDWGTKILSRTEHVAECVSYCWDVESNNRKSIPFTVKLVRDTKQGPKVLTDERDIYELIQNYGQRRVRSCIQAMIPADIIEDAIAKVRETVKKGEGSLPFEQRVTNLLLALDKEFGVKTDMIERKLGHSVSQINAEEFIELFEIGNALKDKQATREDFFDLTKKIDTAEMLKTEPKEKK